MSSKPRKTLLERFKSQVKFYQGVLNDPRTPKSTKYFLGLAVAYALSPIDVIPDAISVIGYLDDLIIIPALIFIAMKLVPENLLAEMREAEYLKSISAMVTSIQKYADLSVFKLVGAVDANTLPSIENIFAENEKNLDRDIVFDFKAVTNIDTSTLAGLIYLINKLKENNHRLGLINCDDMIKQYIKVNNLGGVIRIYESINDAFRK